LLLKTTERTRNKHILDVKALERQEHRQDELESLLLRQQSRALVASEHERLAHLQQQADRTMLRKVPIEPYL
jgi:hypothetical protein